MIVGKNFFITEMPKTGTTFLRNYFSQYSNVELTIHHETLNENKRYNLLDFQNKIGTIRNPYEWYLSLWKWSCKKKEESPIYNDFRSIRLKLRRLKLNNRIFRYIFTQITKDKKKLETLFSDVNSKKNFNKFLEIMLNFNKRYLISSEYSFVPFKNLGYMTYIFFSQNVLRKDYNTMYNSNYKLSEILIFNNSKLYTKKFFKTERLNISLKKFLQKNHFKVKSFKILKRNSSTKLLNKDFKKFFLKKNILLIEKKEDYIFKKFGYKKIYKNL